MRRSLSLLVLFLLVGCGPQHFARKGSNGVSLYLDAPDAHEVLFASSTDNYQLHRTDRAADGLWCIADLNDQEFKYFYLVDGSLYTPACRYRQNDDFGTYNCVYQP